MLNLLDNQISYLQRFYQAKHNEKYFKKNSKKVTYDEDVQQIISYATNLLAVIHSELETYGNINFEKVVEKYENRTCKEFNSSYTHLRADEELVKTLLSYQEFLDVIPECSKVACENP